MKLELLYRSAEEAIRGLDLARIWPGFAPLKFALFDAEQCFFDGQYVEKTDDFCANTAISYQGETIATWRVEGELSLPVLVSKLVHEMFHGFQRLQGWDCWADEMEALNRYEYSPEALSLKLRENALLCALLAGHRAGDYRELLSHRRRRWEQYPYETGYESRVEEIEGSAAYVEWMVLQQLDAAKAKDFTDRMCRSVTDPKALLPIRISCYDTGALLFHAMAAAGDDPFTPAARPAILTVQKSVPPSDGAFPGKAVCLQAAADAINAYQQTAAAMVRAALDKHAVALEGPAELLGLNIYDARRVGNALTSRYFLMVRQAGAEKTLYGDFVIQMLDERTIGRVYRM